MCMQEYDGLERRATQTYQGTSGRMDLRKKAISSPLYHALSLPNRPVINLDLPSTPTPRRAPAVPRSLNAHDVITPSGDTPALCRSAHPPRQSTALDVIQPMCLDFSECIATHNVVTDSSDDTMSTLLHMHTKTCMCGALCDLLAAPSSTGNRKHCARTAHIFI